MIARGTKSIDLVCDSLVEFAGVTAIVGEADAVRSSIVTCSLAISEPRRKTVVDLALVILVTIFSVVTSAAIMIEILYVMIETIFRIVHSSTSNCVCICYLVGRVDKRLASTSAWEIIQVGRLDVASPNISCKGGTRFIGRNRGGCVDRAVILLTTKVIVVAIAAVRACLPVWARESGRS